MPWIMTPVRYTVILYESCLATQWKLWEGWGRAEVTFTQILTNIFFYAAFSQAGRKPWLPREYGSCLNLMRVKQMSSLNIRASQWKRCRRDIFCSIFGLFTNFCLSDEFFAHIRENSWVVGFHTVSRNYDLLVSLLMLVLLLAFLVLRALMLSSLLLHVVGVTATACVTAIAGIRSDTGVFITVAGLPAIAGVLNVAGVLTVACVTAVLSSLLLPTFVLLLAFLLLLANFLWLLLASMLIMIFLFGAFRYWTVQWDI